MSSAAQVKNIPAPASRILRLPEVESRVGLKRSSIYALIQKGKFPKQLKLSERCSGWLESSVNRWIEERIEASTQGGVK